jgi:puromycin-sensitive aminopeptidase
VIPEALAAATNTRVTCESPAGPGKKAVAFADTIRMSTYLVAFVVGELEATPPVMVGPTPLRVWCVPGKLHLARFALEIGAFALDYFERYYGQPYPGDKLDMLDPRLRGGAVEKPGAITIGDRAPVGRAAPPTPSASGRRCVATSPMWFGDP